MTFESRVGHCGALGTLISTRKGNSEVQHYVYILSFLMSIGSVQAKYMLPGSD